MRINNIYAIGVMSGTSLDGIDISLISSDGKNKFEHYNSRFYRYKNQTRKSLINTIDNFTLNKHSIGKIIECEKLVTEAYLRALKNFLKDHNQKKIRLIALHGQTIFHSSKLNSSLQICNKDKIVKEFNIPVINDFRQKDLLFGGEGAPLVPIFHRLLINKLKIETPCCFINIGGISNMTLLSDNKKIISYDVGPGMCLLDKFVYLKRKKLQDDHGLFSSKGNIDFQILSKLLKDKYFYKKFPKSLDRNYFSLNYVMDKNFYDGCATLSAFTAFSLIRELKKYKIKKILLSGGGVKNIFIFNLLKDEYGSKILSIDDLYGFSKFIESQAFGYLGIRSFKKLPISFPSTTGVRVPVTGGVLTNLSKL